MLDSESDQSWNELKLEIKLDKIKNLHFVIHCKVHRCLDRHIFHNCLVNNWFVLREQSCDNSAKKVD